MWVPRAEGTALGPPKAPGKAPRCPGSCRSRSSAPGVTALSGLKIGTRRLLGTMAPVDKQGKPQGTWAPQTFRPEQWQDHACEGDGRDDKSFRNEMKGPGFQVHTEPLA